MSYHTADSVSSITDYFLLSQIYTIYNMYYTGHYGATLTRTRRTTYASISMLTTAAKSVRKDKYNKNTFHVISVTINNVC